MALVSVLLPAFFFEEEHDIQKQIYQQLGMKNDQFQLCSLYPTFQVGGEQDHPYKEYAIKMVQSDLSLRRIEGILEEQYITQKKVEKCKEALTTLSTEFNNIVQSPGLKDLDSQLQKRTKKLKQVKEDNRKLRQLLKAQLENSEKIRIETQTTVETLREEFDLLVRELSNIQKKDFEGVPGGNQYGQVQQNYIQVQPLNNKMNVQQSQQGQQQQQQAQYQQQQQYQQQVNGGSVNQNQNIQQIQIPQKKPQNQQSAAGYAQQGLPSNPQQPQNNIKMQQLQQQQSDYQKNNYYPLSAGAQSTQQQQTNQQSIPIQKMNQLQNAQVGNSTQSNSANNQNIRSMQVGSFGTSSNNSNNNSGHNQNNLANNQNIPLQLKNLNNNNNHNNNYI